MTIRVVVAEPGKPAERDFAELCKLVDRARQHLQVIGSNSALLKE